MRLTTYLLPLLPHALLTSALALNLPPTTPLIASTLTTPTLTPHCDKILNPPQPPLKAKSCTAAIRPTCKKLTLTTHPTPRDQWIWTEPFGRGGCALGWYLPTHARVPDSTACSEVLKAIVDQCTSVGNWNAGAVNVDEMPGLTGDGTAVDKEEMRWFMAPQQLTR